MRLVQGFAHRTSIGQARNKSAYTAPSMGSVRLLLLGLLSLCLVGTTLAQAPALAPPAAATATSTPMPPTAQGAVHKGGAPVTPPLPPPIAEPAWSKLNAAQREALEPLSGLWDSMSEARKRKWLAVAVTVPTLAASEREKMHERMEEWARLSRNQRELARLNFTQSKNLRKTNRAADWEAYQALSPDQRKRLAESAHHKPAGAALSLKPAPEKKLIQVPVTRHTPLPERRAAIAQLQLDRHTLLPLPPPQTSHGATAPNKP